MTHSFGDFPPTLANNDTVTACLMVVFLLVFVSTARLKRFLVRQTHNFLYRPKSDKIFVQTGGEQQYQLLLLVVTSIALALTAALLTDITQTGALLLLTAITMATMTVKLALHIAVGHIFFCPQDYRLWEPSLIYINTAEGVLLMPAVLTHIYHGMSPTLFLAYVALVLLAVKAATLVKAWKTLHEGQRRPALFLLYFWAVEVTPLLILAAVVAVGVGYEP